LFEQKEEPAPKSDELFQRILEEALQKGSNGGIGEKKKLVLPVSSEQQPQKPTSCWSPVRRQLRPDEEFITCTKKSALSQVHKN
jgi:hypothetical protein